MYAGSLNRKQIISVYKYWLEKRYFFEQSHQGRQSLVPLSVDADCVKLQAVTKQSAEVLGVGFSFTHCLWKLSH